MRKLLISLALATLGIATAPAHAQFSMGIGVPGISIGINVPVYPRLAPVPGYPVYYAPGMYANYFFHDGLFWVFQGNNWYASSWYNGPWQTVSPVNVPVYLLRVPVRYYRQPPSYFRAWRPDVAPHWDEHWGREWQQRRSDWHQGGYARAPHAAPMPSYQRQYSGYRYPSAVEQQREIRSQNYHYQPHETVARQHYENGPQHPPGHGERNGQQR